MYIDLYIQIKHNLTLHFFLNSVINYKVYIILKYGMKCLNNVCNR